MEHANSQMNAKKYVLIAGVVIAVIVAAFLAMKCKKCLFCGSMTITPYVYSSWSSSDPEGYLCKKCAIEYYGPLAPGFKY